jgi:hypothetical protein
MGEMLLIGSEASMKSTLQHSLVSVTALFLVPLVFAGEVFVAITGLVSTVSLNALDRVASMINIKKFYAGLNELLLLFSVS